MALPRVSIRVRLGGTPASPGREFRAPESRPDWGLKGTFQGCVALGGDGTLPTQQLGGSNEDGEKSSPRYRSGFGCGCGAQAADLPVKAKPVEYVKICTLYGDGFYYIPGTDTCLTLGGYIRADYGWKDYGARSALLTGAAGAQDRTVSPFSTRHRLNMQIDTRTQTAYGTLRTFSSFHSQNEDQTETTNTSRAFIQWAGFTFGRTASFTDPPGSMGDSGFRSLFQTQNQSDTGANGTNQIAYTWELGNGTTLSVGADERRQRSIYNASIGGPTLGSSLNNDQFGSVNPTTTAGGQHPTPWPSLNGKPAWGA